VPAEQDAGVPLPFVLRALVAAAAGFMLLALGVSGLLATIGWALLALAVGSELLASAVFVRRDRASRRRRRNP
jgi:hypothetical protein